MVRYDRRGGKARTERKGKQALTELHYYMQSSPCNLCTEQGTDPVMSKVKPPCCQLCSTDPQGEEHAQCPEKIQDNKGVTSYLLLTFCVLINNMMCAHSTWPVLFTNKGITVSWNLQHRQFSIWISGSVESRRIMPWGWKKHRKDLV